MMINGILQEVENLDSTYTEAGEVSGVCKGIGETHISSNGIFPTLSTNPGVEVLLGNAAEKMIF